MVVFYLSLWLFNIENFRRDFGLPNEVSPWWSSVISSTLPYAQLDKKYFSRLRDSGFLLLFFLSVTFFHLLSSVDIVLQVVSVSWGYQCNASHGHPLQFVIPSYSETPEDILQNSPSYFPPLLYNLALI